jgi:hypothetical protein
LNASWGLRIANGKKYEYRDPSLLTSWLNAFIWTLIAIVIVNVVCLFLQYTLLGEMKSGAFPDRDTMMAAARASDLRVKLASAIMLIASLATTVIFFFWLYRASANVHAMGAKDLNATPGFAVGMYFIPFFNLYMPPVVMSGIRKASIGALNWNAQKGTPLIALWWAFQLLSGVGGGISFVAGRTQPHTIDSIRTLTAVLIAIFVSDVLYRIFLVLLTREISREQLVQRANTADTAEMFA